MRNYFTDPDGMSMPFCESPFFYTILQDKLRKGELTHEQAEQVISFHDYGYLIIDLNLEDEFIESLISKMDEKIMEGAVKTQDGRYHYSKGPRVFEAWKWCPEVLALARNEKAMSTIQMLYGREPQPFQTINFKYGTNQPIHSDAVHFHTQPERWVCGCWVALEDLDENCGPLVYYPESHREPIVEFQELNMQKTEYGQQFDNYAEYEHWLQQWVEAKNFQPQYFTAKKGQALIWAANLVHGGAPPKNENATRWSQVVHVYFPGCNHYYTPFFSNRWEGEYSEKPLENKDIKNHVIDG